MPQGSVICKCCGATCFVYDGEWECAFCAEKAKRRSKWFILKIFQNFRWAKKFKNP